MNTEPTNAEGDEMEAILIEATEKANLTIERDQLAAEAGRLRAALADLLEAESIATDFEGIAELSRRERLTAQFEASDRYNKALLAAQAALAEAPALARPADENLC